MKRNLKSIKGLFIAVCWSDIYPSTLPKETVLNLLTGIDPYVILFTCWIINDNLLNGKSIENDIIRKLPKNEKIKYSYEINKLLIHLNKIPSKGEKKGVFNQKSNYELIKIVMSNYGHFKNKSINNFESYNFIKAYLIINEKNYNENSYIRGIPKTYVRCLSQFSLLAKTFEYDSVYHQLFIFARIRTLFEYLERNYTGFINTFQKENKIDNLDIYIFKLMKILSISENQNVLKFEERNLLSDYFDNISINFKSNYEKSEPKYTPLLKDLELEGTYYILNRGHFLLNFYHKAKSDAFKLLKSKFKSYNAFHSDYADKGGEEILFRTLIKNSIKNNHYTVKFNDNDKSSVDCVIINNKHVFLFEFKDYESIHNLDSENNYERIYETLEKTFVKGKGIGQLIKFIKNLKNYEPLERVIIKNKLKYKNIEVYPILVVSNSFYSSPSLEHYLSIRMKEEVSNINFDFKIIRKLSIIDLDSLIKFIYYDDQFDLIKSLKEYVVKKQNYREGNNLFLNYPSFSNKLSKASTIKNSDFLINFLKNTNFKNNDEIKNMPKNFFERNN